MKPELNDIASVPVFDEYRAKIASLQCSIAASGVRKSRALVLAVGCGVLCASALLTAQHASGLALAVASTLCCGAAGALRVFLKTRSETLELMRRESFYESGIARIYGRWRGNGKSGIEFARPHHLYQHDLEVLGEGSLFELLNTTRSAVGAERLAALLLDPCSLDEARARQDAVKELRGATGLREAAALLGKYSFQNCNAKHLNDWLNLPVMTVAGVVPAFLMLSSVVSIILVFCGYGRVFSWMQILPLLAPWLAAQALIGLWLRDKVKTRLKTLLPLSVDVGILRKAVELLAQQHFKSGRLRELVVGVRSGKAEECMRKLGRLLTALERREDTIVYGFSLWFAAATQLVLATERWRAAHQSELRGWLDAWAEFEALCALAGYAYEHAEDEFPELLDGQSCFEARDLRHPLLQRHQAVGNDLMLNGEIAFYLISGSNMAGKSTLLRAVGLNAVLAAAGAPVSGKDARISVLNVCASISIVDSRADGKSKFLAEVERLRAAISATDSERPVLFLIDEILSGTNSHDRRVAAEAVIRALAKGGAIGALSTHDLALTEIAVDATLRGVNVHMRSEDANQPLAFDYRLKLGALRETNGLAIVKMLGIQV